MKTQEEILAEIDREAEKRAEKIVEEKIKELIVITVILAVWGLGVYLLALLPPMVGILVVIALLLGPPLVYVIWKRNE